MITYLLQLTICWSVFYAAYYFLLRHETHFVYSRWYLVSSLVVGILIPLVDWTRYFVHEPESLGHLYITPLNEQLAYWDITVTATETQTWNSYDYLVLLYALGAILSVLKLVHSWVGIVRIRRQSQQIHQDGYTLVLTDGNHLPFSFLESVFISREFFQKSNAHLDQILAHEVHHIRARHSYDIIFLEILKIVFWFHPVVYIYKNEIQQVHEYQADHAAYKLSSKRQYGQLLLNQVVALRPVALANPLFNSQLKNRFKMMTKQSSTRQTVWKYLVMMPLVAFTIVLFSYSSQGKSLIDKVWVMQDTIIPPPPPPVPAKVQPAPPPPQPPVPSGAKEVTVVGYSANEATPGVPPPPPPPPPTQKSQEVVVTGHPAPPKEVFRVVEQMPRFPGCEDMETVQEKKECADQKFLEYVYTHVRYPSEARQNGIEGIVVVQFIVEEDGSITNPEVLREPDPSLGEEALRLIHLMASETEWTPGQQRGKNVRVSYILPIKFALDKKQNEDPVLQDRTHEISMDKPVFVLNGQVLGHVEWEQVNKTIKPDDIESVQVFKGKSAIDKYGEVAKHGVVEITTKWPKFQETNLHLESVNLFPVPATNELHIQTTVADAGEYKLEIRNMKGQVTRQNNIHVQDGILESTMSLEGLNSGPYYLVILHRGKIFTQAFIKQ